MDNQIAPKGKQDRDAEVERLLENLLDLDSEFQFKCRRCGKCCKHQNTIILTGRDIFNIAHKLDKTTEEVIDEIAEFYIGKSSRIPIVHLLPKGPGESCPLLKNGLCSVHDCKPTVCALYPLGRVFANKINEDGTIDPDKSEVKYILNKTECGSITRKNTVRSWLARFGIPEEDPFFLLWNKMIMEQGNMIRRLEELQTTQAYPVFFDLIWNIQYALLYIRYDTDKEFMPQFEAAAAKLHVVNEVLQQIDHLDLSVILSTVEALGKALNA